MNHTIQIPNGFLSSICRAIRERSALCAGFRAIRGTFSLVLALCGGVIVVPVGSFAVSAPNDHFWYYHDDNGASYGRRANGMVYGWNVENKTAVDRNDSLSQDDRYDRSLAMSAAGEYKWEIELPNGDYRVLLVAGDPITTDAIYRFNIEGKLALDGVPTKEYPWVSSLTEVRVSDGKLTLSNAPGARNNRICYIHITSPGAATATSVPRRAMISRSSNEFEPSFQVRAGSLIFSNAVARDQVSVWDLSGKLAIEHRFGAVGNTVSLVRLSPGIYLLRCRRDGNEKTYSMVLSNNATLVRSSVTLSAGSK